MSPFLVRELRAGDQIEVHGPLGSFFLWRPGQSQRPVQLIAGRSGVVPLYAMAASHAAASIPFRSGCCTRCVRPKTSISTMSSSNYIRTGRSPWTSCIRDERQPDGRSRPAHDAGSAGLPPRKTCLPSEPFRPWGRPLMLWLRLRLCRGTSDVLSTRAGRDAETVDCRLAVFLLLGGLGRVARLREVLLPGIVEFTLRDGRPCGRRQPGRSCGSTRWVRS